MNKNSKLKTTSKGTQCLTFNTEIYYPKMIIFFYGAGLTAVYLLVLLAWLYLTPSVCG